jgi:hypothetical protein
VCAVAIAGTGVGALFIELLLVKLGMGKSVGAAFGFCCTQMTTLGIKLVRTDATSSLQAATEARTASALVSALFFSNARATFSSIVT